MDEPVVGARPIILLLVCSFVVLGGVTVVSAQENTSDSGPTAAFEYSPTTPTPDEDVIFDASDSEASSGEIEDYSWEFETATGSSEGYYEESSQSWDERGEYDVTLEVTDDSGETDSITKTITVDADDPTAAFEYAPTTPAPDEDVTFDASGSEAPAGEIEDYSWDFEKVTGSSEGYYEESSQSWDERGEYEVTLTVTDNGGATDSVTKTIEVSAEGPTAAFEYSPTTPSPDEDVTFDASGSEAPAGEIEDYSWEFETATGSSEGYYEESSQSWDERGEYEVTLEVTDNGGATDSLTKIINVSAEGPTASFEYSPTTPSPDEDVTFDASASEAPAGDIEDYSWDFETATGSSEGYYEESSQSWDERGEYEVTLEVTDNGGATDSVTKTITVDAADPIASFEYTPTNPTPDEDVTFDASESEAPAGEIEDYDWEFETATGSSEGYYEETTQSWSEGGSYEVTLEVTDNGGATAETSKTVEVVLEDPGGEVEVRETESTDETTDGSAGSSEITEGEASREGPEISDAEPVAKFEYSPVNPSPKDRIVFDPSPSKAVGSDIVGHRWFINGDPAYRGRKLATNFEEPAIYIVELEVIDRAGNTDRVSKSIPVGDKEDRVDNPDFTLERTSPETTKIETKKGRSVSFTADIAADEIPEATKSVYIDGSLVSKSEVDSNNIRSTYQFEDYGDHTVEIEVTGVAGKSDTLKWDVTVHPFNSVPIAAEQSSTTEMDIESETEILTFSIENPSVNERDITSQLVTQLPDGISVSGTAGTSTTTSAIQTASETISPGEQGTMRLSITVEDDSLQGETIRIPYQVRYHPTSNNSIIYTSDRGSLDIQIGESEQQVETSDSSPGFDFVVAGLSLVLATMLARIERV